MKSVQTRGRHFGAVPLLCLILLSGMMPSCSTQGSSRTAGATAPEDTSRPYVEHIVPEMVLVEGGTFQMGDEVGDLWPGTRPVHTVTLTYDYLIGRYLITFDQYDNYCEAAGADMLSDFGWGREDRPVMNLAWWDMVRYCNWLSEREGLKPAYSKDYHLLDSEGNVTTDITRVVGYRLPTEAEWEYAASGGHKALPIPPRTLFSGSNNLDEVGWYSGNSGEEWVFTGSSSRVDYSRHGGSLYEGRSTQPVGLKKPNELGLYDMSGNVWEWCHDWYGEYTEESAINPIGAQSGHVRVMRGGSWIFGANDCRVGNRFYRSEYDQVFRLGFRIARTGATQ